MRVILSLCPSMFVRLSVCMFVLFRFVRTVGFGSQVCAYANAGQRTKPGLDELDSLALFYNTFCAAPFACSHEHDLFQHLVGF